MATAGENLGPVLLKSMWVGAAVVSATMVTRFYVRARLVARIAPDDWIMLLAYALILTESGLDTAAVHYGYGQHQWLLDEAHASPAAKWNIIAQAVGILGVAIARIAFATMLMEVLSPQQRFQRTFLWIIIISQLLINFSLSILTLTQCSPPRKLWDKAVDGHCLPPEVQEYFGFIQGSTSALTDLCLTVLPSTIIWKLNMKLSTRVSLSMVLGLGVFAMVGSIMKTIYLKRLTQVDDYTYETTCLVLWFNAEACLIIIAATIPTLRPLFSSHRSRYHRHSGEKQETGHTLPTRIIAHPDCSSTNSDCIELTDRFHSDWYHRSGNTQQAHEPASLERRADTGLVPSIQDAEGG